MPVTLKPGSTNCAAPPNALSVMVTSSGIADLRADIPELEVQLAAAIEGDQRSRSDGEDEVRT